MTQLIALGRGWMASNQHWVSATIGPPGTGKSGFNLCLAIALQSPAPFSPVQQVAMRPKDRKELSQMLGPGMAILDDESTGQGGHRRRSMSTENVDNAQDMDAMRGRRQATLLTAPDYGDLDTILQKHCKWLFDLDRDGNGLAYEIVQSGKPNNRFWNPVRRFEIDGFPHASVAYPAVWSAYTKMKMDFLAGVDVLGAEKEKIRRQEWIPAVRRLLDEDAKSGRSRAPFPLADSR